VLAPPDPALAAASSRRLRRASAVLFAAFAGVLAVLWLTRDPAPSPQVAGMVIADPFAARRQAATAGQDAAPAAAPEGQDRPFLDPAGAGTTAYASGDYATSLAQYLAAVEKNPQDAESLSNLGQVLVRLNRTPEAIPYFERAIAILPGRWTYQFNLARALGLVGRMDESIAGYRRAQQLFPDDYATTFNLALALHKKGDEAGAVEQYLRAIDLQPEDATFRKALGVSYERLQKGKEAAAAYHEYLRLSPSAPDADSVRARVALLEAPAAPVAAPPASPGPPATR
jgi:tetratricopeptide (TPR) repeat protein